MTLATPDAKRELLRHTVATVAYRGAKILRGAPAGFAAFLLGPGTRTPVEILAHISDLFEWATHLAEGRQIWHAAPAGTWESEIQRFFSELSRFDAVLASRAPLGCSSEQLFQGPVADALTHIGQLALLRRRTGTPVRAENYAMAEIGIGRLAAAQATSLEE